MVSVFCAVLRNSMDVYDDWNVKRGGNDPRRCAGARCPKRDRTWAGVLPQSVGLLSSCGRKNRNGSLK